MKQHPTSIVDPKAEVADDVEIGPFCIVGAGARIGSGSKLLSHVVLHGCVSAGENNTFHPFTSIGDEPQDLSYAGEPTSVVIGDGNVFREYFCVHRGTAQSRTKTTIGSNNFFMACTHIAHDCVVGSQITFANYGCIAGHTVLEDHTSIGAYCGTHQNCRVGIHAFLGAGTVVTRDIMPYSMVVAGTGNRAKMFGPNVVGLKRKGFSPDAIKNIRRVYKLLCKSGLNTSQALEKIAEDLDSTEEVMTIVNFIKSTKRGVVK